MIDVSVLKAMAAAGAPLEVIFAALEADNAIEESKLALQRSKEAEKKRRQRAAQKETQPVPDVPPCPPMSPPVPGTTGDTNFAIYRKEESKKDLLEEEKKESKTERKSGNRLPDDWVPSSGDVEYGGALGLSESQISGSAEDLRLWAAANANRAVGRKSNWSATFKGWMRRVAEKQAARQQPLSLREEKQERWHAAIAKVREFANRAEEGGESGGEIIRLLPALGGKQ